MLVLCNLIHKAILHIFTPFDPKNPREMDRAIGFTSASQMKKMRLREVKGFAQHHVPTKGQSQVFQVLDARSVGGYGTKKGKRSSLQKSLQTFSS